MRTLEVVARDPGLTPHGLIPYTSAELVLSHLAVGSWTVRVPASRRTLEWARPGWGVLVLLDGEQVMSGSIEEVERARDGPGLGELVLSGSDDLAVVAGATAWPDPTFPVGEQRRERDARSGPAETVIKGYVAANIGAGRAASRRDPAAPDVREVVVADDRGEGSEVSYSARFDPLLDIVRAVSGGLGVTCGQRGDALVFDTFTPRDLSRSALFSFEVGNLASVKWVDGAPTLTHAIVAGQDDDTIRPLRIRADSATANLWRVAVEEFVDARTTEWDAIDQAGDEALADGRRSGIVSATLIDTPRLRFGSGYRVGDRVTISPAPGNVFTDIVTSVTITADQDGVRVVPAVGWDGAGPYQTRADREIAQINRRLGRLERTL